MSDSVDFRHLKYLIAIHEGKNFTKAAERVYPEGIFVWRRTGTDDYLWSGDAREQNSDDYLCGHDKSLRI